MIRTSLSTSRGALRSLPPSQSVLRTPQTLTQRTITTARLAHSKHSLSSSSQPTTFTFSSHARRSPSSSINSTIQQRLRSTLRNFHSSRMRLNGKPSSPNPTPNLGSPGAAGAAEAQPTSLSARLQKLGREYGWSALGVYLALTALDFPFCYMFVKYMGADVIGEWEHTIVSAVKGVIPDSIKQKWHDWRVSMKKAEHDIEGSNEVTEHVEMAGWGVEEAEEANKRDASLATQLALAYAIHKAFIFIRVPLTATITPKVVRILRGWGWDIGKRTTKEAKALKRAATPPKKK